MSARITKIFENSIERSGISINTSLVTQDQNEIYVMVVGRSAATPHTPQKVLALHATESLKSACANHQKAVLLTRLNRLSLKKIESALQNADFN